VGALESVARALKTLALPTPSSPWPRQLLVAVPPGHASPADLVERVAVAGHPTVFLEPNEDPLPLALLHVMHPLPHPHRFPPPRHHFAVRRPLQRLVQLISRLERHLVVMPGAGHAGPPVDILDVPQAQRPPRVVTHAVEGKQPPGVPQHRDEPPPGAHPRVRPLPLPERPAHVLPPAPAPAPAPGPSPGPGPGPGLHPPPGRGPGRPEGWPNLCEPESGRQLSRARRQAKLAAPLPLLAFPGYRFMCRQHQAKGGGLGQQKPGGRGGRGGGGRGGMAPAAGAGAAGARVRVVARVRPALRGELGEGEAPACTPEGGARVRVGTAPREADRTGGRRPGETRRETRREFELDACLGPEASQDDVFEACRVAELTEAALEGYAVTIFAFGQTGSGKTHTVVGPDFGRTQTVGGAAFPSSVRGCDGILQRGIAHAFDRAAMSSTSGFDYAFSVSLTEIYNEQVGDLQSTSGGALAVRHHPQKGFFVEGLQATPCFDLAGALATIYNGLNRRRVGSHNLNEASSRSHCLVSIHVHRKGGGQSRFGKITFADLAGSERLKSTGSNANKASHRETGSINKSLFVLGKVISALSKGGSSGRQGGNPAGGGPFVPYRDSKLTQLLIDSLGGRGRAAMLACCSPLGEHCEETLNTLHFAELALNVKSQPIVILDPQDQMILDLHATIKALRDDNRQLAEQLSAAMNGAPAPGSPQEMAAQQSHSLAAPLGALEVSTGGLVGEDQPKKAGLGKDTRERLVRSREKQRARAPGGAESAVKARKADRQILHPVTHHNNGEGASPYLQPSGPPRNVSRSLQKQQERPDSEGAASRRAASPKRRAEAHQVPPISAELPVEAPPTPDELSFPDLDALESAFRSKLAATLEGSGEPAMNPGNHVGGDSDVLPELEPEPEPEQAAIEWAKRNPWFGNDMDMTEFAYDVHDCLVDEEGIDPSSSKYYALLEGRVREEFPDRMPALPKEASPKKSFQRGWGRDYQRSEAEISIQGEMRKLSQSVKPPLPDFRRTLDSSKPHETVPTQAPLSPQRDPQPGNGSVVQKRSHNFSGRLSRQAPQDSVEWGSLTAEESGQTLRSDQDYMKQRQHIIEELRKAKEEAEIEKKKMLAMISNSLHRSGHRVF